jgi:xanthine dioxygenase
MSLAKSRSDDLGMASEGLELPLSDLSFQSMGCRLTFSRLCWQDPVTGKLALVAHLSAIKAVHLANGDVITDLKEARELVHRLQRPGIPQQYVYPHDGEEGDFGFV